MATAGAPVGAVSGGFEMPKMFAGNPAAVVLALFVAAAVAIFAFARFYDPEPAKAIFLEAKRAEQKLAIDALQEDLRQKRLQKSFKDDEPVFSGLAGYFFCVGPASSRLPGLNTSPNVPLPGLCGALDPSGFV